MSEERANYLESGSGDPANRERLDAIRAILGDETAWAEPPAWVGDEVMEQVAAESRPAVVARRSPWLAVAVILGALVVAVGAAAAGVFEDPVDAVIAMDGTELQPGAVGEAAIRATGSGWWIRLDTEGLPPADEGSYYEGWMWNDQGHGVSIGTFHLRDDAEPVILWSGVDPEDYRSVWVTLEDEDGDPTASDLVVMRGRSGE